MYKMTIVLRGTDPAKVEKEARHLVKSAEEKGFEVEFGTEFPEVEPTPVDDSPASRTFDSGAMAV